MHKNLSILFKLKESLISILVPTALAIVYFIILTPISLLIRVFGRDYLSLKFSNRNGVTFRLEKSNQMVTLIIIALSRSKVVRNRYPFGAEGF